jgi:phospholipid N-methyltransferase
MPVHLVVTSPPYWNLKKYPGEANENQLGHIDDRHAFLAELAKVWRGCYDRLVPGGNVTQLSYSFTPPQDAVPGRFTVEKSKWVTANLPPGRVWIYRPS